MAQVSELLVNGTRRKVSAEGGRSLLEVLREDLEMTGAKYGCGEGQCGACTVLLDGKAVRSCSTTVAEAAGKPVTTIEGLERDGRLHPVQEAFLAEGSLQCGYCTPGMVMSAVSLLRQNPHPVEADVVRAMNGNVCRCGTYGRIVKAILRAAAAPGGGTV